MQKFEVTSTVSGEVDSFYHWLRENSPELLEISGVSPVFEGGLASSDVMGMPGKTILKLVYEGPDTVSYEVGEKLKEFRDAVEQAGGSLTLQEVSEDQSSNIFKKVGRLIRGK